MDTENQQIIDSICGYAEQHKIKEILQEYMRRLVMDRPANPVEYLIKTTQENPYYPDQQDANSTALTE